MWGKCCALPILTAGLFLCCATQNGLVKSQKETTRFLSREVKVELANRECSLCFLGMHKVDAYIIGSFFLGPFCCCF